MRRNLQLVLIILMEEDIRNSIPIPVIDKLGKPNTIKFVINDDTNTIELISGKTHVSRKGMKVNY